MCFQHPCDEEFNGKAKQDVLIQYQTHHGAMEAWEPMEVAQDPRKHRVLGRRLRVGITRIIQHAGLLDAIERNRTEQNNIEQSKTQQSSTILYYTILYYTILYYTILYYTILYYILYYVM